MVIDTNINHSILTSNQKSTEEKLDNSFDSQLDSSEHDSRYVQEKTQKEIIANMEKLVEDIDSVMRTGMTPEELEQLEKLLERIKEEMNEKYPDEKKIKQLLDDLEKEIARFKKEITGEAVIEAEDLEKPSQATESIAMLRIEERMDKAQQGIDELKEYVQGKQPTQLYSQSELLQEIKQFQNL